MKQGVPSGWQYVAAQLILLLIIVLAPGGSFGFPNWMALPMIIIGLILVALAGSSLGSALSVLPRPTEAGDLVTTGLYGVVRHPIYTGVLLSALGWALLRGSTIGLVVTVVLFVLFDRKAAVEEGHLSARFAGYAAYKARVRKLIPLVY